MKHWMKRHSARGFTVTEGVLAGSVLMMVIAVLAAAVQQHETLAKISAERRDAAWQVEGLLVQLQTGQLPISSNENLTIEKLPDVAPSGGVWVQVRETTSNGEVSLIGVVPQTHWKKHTQYYENEN